MKTGTIVSAYTRDNGYATEVARLSASLDALNIPYLIEGYDSKGSWVENCAYKASYLFQVRGEVEGPILWVDADAVVKQNPWPLLDLEGADIAAHKLYGRELLSGTLYIADTQAAEKALGQWVAHCSESPGDWDQKCLQRVLIYMGDEVGFTELDPEMCWIDGGNKPDISERAYGPRRPVIVHTQASRRLRH